MSAVMAVADVLPWLSEGRRYDIETIAHALSHLCRFGGHTTEFYSVAQHSVLVSRACARDLALWGLLHDAAEAYLGDVVRPLKLSEAMAGYRQIEAAMLTEIADVYDLPGRGIHDDVRDADEFLCQVEMRDLLPASVWPVRFSVPVLRAAPIVPWPSAVARRKFLDTFDQLTEGTRYAR